MISSNELRQQVVDFLGGSPHYLDGPPISYADTLTKADGSTVDQYLSNMRLSCTFGDELTLTAMSCLYRVQFVVASSLGPGAIRVSYYRLLMLTIVCEPKYRRCC